MVVPAVRDYRLSEQVRLGLELSKQGSNRGYPLMLTKIKVQNDMDVAQRVSHGGDVSQHDKSAKLSARTSGCVVVILGFTV